MAQEGGVENVICAANEVDSKMNSDTPVTDTAFEAFLRCDTKPYLLHEDIANQWKRNFWENSPGQQFKQGVSEWLTSIFGDEVYVGTPSRRMLKQGSHRIVLRPLIKSSALCAEPDALW